MKKFIHANFRTARVGNALMTFNIDKKTNQPKLTYFAIEYNYNINDTVIWCNTVFPNFVFPNQPSDTPYISNLNYNPLTKICTVDLNFTNTLSPNNPIKNITGKFKIIAQ